jgi:predicted secreted protein
MTPHFPNAWLAAACLAGACTLASAETPPPSGVVNLTATASVEVARDLMSVTLGTTREGPDAGTVQAGLKQALDAALAEARRVAKPGQVDVQTGNFTLHPRYTNKGQMAGWQGTAELIVEGRDMPAIAQLTGRITTLTVSRVTQGLSRELREKTEGEVVEQAISRYRAKAAEYTKHFGYTGYLIREVNVSANEQPGPPVPMMRMQVMAKEDAALPVEAGKAPVMVTVSGTVQMLK